MANANLLERRIICCFAYWRLSRCTDAMLVWISNNCFEKRILKANTIVAIFSDTIFKQHVLAQNLAVHPGSWRADPPDKEPSMEPVFRTTMSRNITQGHSFQSDTAKHSCNNLWVLLDMTCIIHFSHINIRCYKEKRLLFRRQEFDSPYSASIILCHVFW